MKLNLLIILTICSAISCSKKESGGSPSPAGLKANLIPEEQKKTGLLTASTSREHSMQIVQDTKTSFGSKMSAANNYFLAFNLQNLSPLTEEERDTDVSPSSIRENIYLEAVIEFNRHIDDISNNIRLKRMSPMQKGKASERAFYAIAATMGATQIPGQVSFYELIRLAMIHEANGKPLEKHEELLMAEPHKTIMINLIKARLDMSAMLALKGLTTKENMTLLQHGSKLLYRISFGLLGGIDLPETFYTSTDTTKDQVVKHLDEARQVKDFLREFQIPKFLEKNVRSALMKVKMEIPEKVSADEDEDQELSELREATNLALQERKKDLRERINYLLQ